MTILTPENPLEHRYQGEHPLQTLWYLFETERPKLAIATVLHLIKHSPVWIMPVITAEVIDIVIQHRPLAELWFYAFISVLLFAQNVPLQYLYVRQLSLAVRNVETRLRSGICHRLQHLSINYYTRTSAGVLQTKILRDVEAVEQLIRQGFDGGLSASSDMVGAMVITAFRAPAFFIFFLVTVPASVLLVRALRGALAERNRLFREELERMSSRVIEMTHLISITRAHGLEQNELERVDQTLHRVQHTGMALDAINALFGALAWAVYHIFNIICLITGAWAAYTGFGGVSAGEVVMLTGYFNTLTNAMIWGANLMPQITKGFDSLRSIGEVLESPDLEYNEGKLPVKQVRGEIEFDQVNFTYPDSPDCAVQNFSLHVAPGETIALVGPSGAGKSTILNLVIGFIRPTQGRILLDKQDMETLDLRTYRQYLSLVPQESILFEGTIRENITYGLGQVTDDEAEAALRDANAWEFVSRLPFGWDTIIGERGARLSGGQKQRLSIARALIRNPRVLILDEATSALDTESEALIQEAFERLMQGRTTFVVAHRLSTIRNAKRIVVMEQGKIAEIGSHAELLAAQGVYARLQQRQMY